MKMRIIQKMKLSPVFFITLLVMSGCMEKTDWKKQEEKTEISAPAVCRAPEGNSNLGIEPAPFDLSLLPKNQKTTKDESYIIPTVFHVFGTDFGNGRTVTFELVDDALRRTNEDFQGLTQDWDAVTPPFDGVKQKMDIEFRLADFDPEGNLTTGVIFYPEEKGLGNANGYNDKIQKYAWNNYKYKNVYILHDLYDDGALNNSGISWYPNTWMSDNNLARTVYNGAYLGNNTDENFRSVLTHEFGHWLNLLHTFEGGCNEEAITGGDEVADTPPADRMYMGQNDRNCFDELTNWQNFMNYSDNYANFTHGQVERMLVALQHASRKPIWQQENLNATLLPEGVVSIVPEDRFFEEDILSNDGTVNDKCLLRIKRGRLIGTPDTYLDAATYSVTGLPEGIECKFQITDAVTLEMILSGKASEHATENSTDFQVKFKNAILETRTLYQDIYNFRLDFIDTYGVRYTPCNESIDANNPTYTFNINTAYLQSNIKLDYVDGKFTMESNGNQIAVGQYRQYIAPIQYGATLDDNIFWGQGELILYSEGYKQWGGVTGYIGFRVQESTGQEVLYGWIKVRVNPDASSCNILGYGWNELPGVPIFAGQRLPDEEPVAVDFLADKTVIEVGAQLTFTALVSPEDQIQSYNWAFEGASPAVFNGKVPEGITYATTGTFNVELAVETQSGEIIELEKEDYIKVNPEINIQVDFNADKETLTVGENVAFHSNCIPISQVVRYEWTFEGGEPASSGEKDPVVTYAVPGIYDVELVAYNQNDKTFRILKNNCIEVLSDDTEANWFVPEAVIIGTGETTFLKVTSENKIVQGSMKLYDSRNKLIFSEDNYTEGYNLTRLKTGTYYYVFKSKGRTLKGVIELVKK